MAILPWLVPALLSTAGSIFTNKSNRGISRDQMNFQERMSNTSAQRSAEDYRKAGLNPGLAYERGASSPAGAGATMGDPASAGVNSAQSARALVQSMQIAQDQSKADLAVKKTQEYKNVHDADLAFENKMEVQRQRQFNTRLEPQAETLATAQALRARYENEGWKNTATFEKGIGALRPGLGASTARLALEIAKAMRGGQ